MGAADYDLALLFQPMLMLGIRIGVAFNLMFANWMVTVLLIILFLDIFLSSGKYSSKSFNEGHRNMEERDKDEEGKKKQLESESKPGVAYGSGEDYKLLPSGPAMSR
ncbi:unnamed protein product [Prunus armeniaca]